MGSNGYLRKPEWLRVRLPCTSDYVLVDRELGKLGVDTVCRSAQCPNIFECFSRKTATFLILGDVCTRNCAFCSITPGTVKAPDPDEPGKVSEAVFMLGLKHIVVTSVTRDDLKDGGAGQFSLVISRLKKDHPGSTIEVLVPDFQGNRHALDTVLEAGPEIFGHNLETVSRLYGRARPKADYQTSLAILKHAGNAALKVRVKTGIMVGLGEEDIEIFSTLKDISGSGCQIVTIGQYLQPSVSNLAVQRYVRPEKFEEYDKAGTSLGMTMFCGPLVRSSYHADKLGIDGRTGR